MKITHLISSVFLLVFLFLSAASSLFAITNNGKLDVKSIGYAPLEYDSSLYDMYNDANNAFAECVLNSFNDLGVIRAQYLPMAIKFTNTNNQQIKDICLKFNLDAFIVTKLQFAIEERIINSNKKIFVDPKKALISMKLYDNEGNIIESASYNSDKVIKLTNYFGENNAIHESVSMVIKKLAKKINFQSPVFRIEQITQQIWRSYKLLCKDGYYKSINKKSMLNLCLFNNSGYFLESNPDSSNLKPSDRFVYKAGNQEIVLQSKTENLTFKVLGFNEVFLILKPIGIEGIEKIYFRRLTEKEVAELLKPRMKGITLAKDTMKSIESSDEPIFFVVEESATFQGGDLNKFRDWVLKNTLYPQEAQEKGMSGKTYVQFVVASDGHLKDLKIIRSSGSEALDKEAIRVISSSPNWKPGKQRGKPVNQLFTMPVSFKMN